MCRKDFCRSTRIIIASALLAWRRFNFWTFEVWTSTGVDHRLFRHFQLTRVVFPCWSRLGSTRIDPSPNRASSTNEPGVEGQPHLWGLAYRSHTLVSICTDRERQRPCTKKKKKTKQTACCRRHYEWLPPCVITVTPDIPFARLWRQQCYTSVFSLILMFLQEPANVFLQEPSCSG